MDGIFGDEQRPRKKGAETRDRSAKKERSGSRGASQRGKKEEAKKNERRGPRRKENGPAEKQDKPEKRQILINLDLNVPVDGGPGSIKKPEGAEKKVRTPSHGGNNRSSIFNEKPEKGEKIEKGRIRRERSGLDIALRSERNT